MRVSVERLRRWLLAGAGLLVLVVAGFLAYGRYRAHRFIAELPHKLGADIRQDTNNFTWSQSVKGKTVFTIHAAKAIQHKDGKYTMHGVEISVYGRGQGQDNRVDHISGKEFELDQAAGVVRAMGEVHLDLQAPPKKTAPDADGKEAKKVEQTPQFVHVKTSGLVYLQKLGQAATDQEIEFEYNGLTGHAKGADYDADNGVLILHSAVQVSGLDHGKPLLLTSSHAELDRANRKVLLTQAKYITGTAEDGGKQTVEARQATVRMRPDGSAERLIGEDGVTVTEENGSQVRSRRGEVMVSEANKPQTMWMTGEVRYTANEELRHANGEAAQAKVQFDRQGHAEKAILTGTVHLNERLEPVSGSKGATERDLSASTVEMSLAADSEGRARLQNAKASGHARLKVIDAAKGGKGQRSSSLAGDVLTASFGMQNGRSHIKEVHGDGATVLEQRQDDGLVQTSSGDTLKVSFRTSPASSASKPGLTGETAGIETAVQQGHVIATRISPAKPGHVEGPEMDRATAEKASYDGDTQRLTLSGSVELQSPDGNLWADRIAMDQKTGDALAQGKVKTSYKQNGKGEVLHVLADQADLKKDSDTAIFHGASGAPARLWQGDSQIEAPVLQFERKQGRLIARGDRGADSTAVHTVLVSVGSSGETKGSKADAQRKPAVVRIASHEMVYSSQAQTAQFSGGVRVQSADGVMRGQQATAYLQQVAKKDGGAMANPTLLGGAVERVTVSGSILIEQNGRRATGDRLVYTASDGVFLLTGTEAQPPKVVDATRGAVTGRELRFREQDESIVISNGDANGGQRVRTETRVKKER